MSRTKTDKGKDRATDLRLRRLYGITLKQYNAKLKKQHGVCAICGRPPRRLRLGVDHNHKTQVVRALLCMICNRKVLGVMERFKIMPEKVVEYLKTYDPTNPLLITPKVSNDR